MTDDVIAKSVAEAPIHAPLAALDLTKSEETPLFAKGLTP